MACLWPAIFFLSLVKTSFADSASEPSSVKKPRMVILGIGVNAYQDKFWPSLRWTDLDVKAMQDELGVDTDFAKESVSLLDTNATKAAVLDQLASLGRELKEDDALIVYVSSHGSLAASSDGRLEPVIVLHDTSSKALLSSGLPHVLLYELLDRIKIKKKLLILANGYAGIGKSKFTRGVTKLVRKNGLPAQVPTPKSTLVLFAASPDEGASEDLAFKADIYTHFFTEGLRDKKQNGPATARDVHAYAEQKTYEYRRERQRPMVGAKVPEGVDVLIYGHLPPPMPATAPSSYDIYPSSLTLLVHVGAFRWLNPVMVEMSDKPIVPTVGLGFALAWRRVATRFAYQAGKGEHYYEEDQVGVKFLLESYEFAVLYRVPLPRDFFASFGPNLTREKFSVAFDDDLADESRHAQDQSLGYGAMIGVGTEFKSGLGFAADVRYQRNQFYLGDYSRLSGNRIALNLASSYVFRRNR